MRPWNFRKYFSLISEVYWWNRFHFWWWVLLNRAPTSTQLHPPPPSSFQPLSSSIQPPPSSFQPPPSSLQHPQYLNQNIACNWAISPNLGPKIERYPFWLKIGTHGILEMFIPTTSRLRFLKFRYQNRFLSKFGPKKSNLFVLSENWCTQYLKDADSESGLRILKFRSQNPFLGKFWSKKSKLFVFPENWDA